LRELWQVFWQKRVLERAEYQAQNISVRQVELADLSWIGILLKLAELAVTSLVEPQVEIRVRPAKVADLSWTGTLPKPVELAVRSLVSKQLMQISVLPVDFAVLSWTGILLKPAEIAVKSRMFVLWNVLWK
jgi:hypothetical protein